MDPRLLLSVTFSGAAFALIGLAVRFGAPRGVDSLHVAVIGMLGGVLFFAPDAARILAGGSIPPSVWLLGLAAGLTQYAAVRLIKTALRMGPLTPLWCAQMLAFVPVILYAGFFLGERILPVHVAALILASLSILFAALNQDPAPAQSVGSQVRPRSVWLYAAVLAGALILNSIANISVKALASTAAPGGSQLQVYGGLFYLMMYLLIWLGSAAELLIARRQPASWALMLVLGLAAGLGSVTGVVTIRIGMTLPAAVSFTLSSTTSILCAALAGALLFGERRTRWWWATVACGAGVILVANSADLLKLLP